MISFIDGPYEDEPLFSLLARIYDRLIGPSRAQFAKHVFGNPRTVIPFDFPCGIDALANSIGRQIGLSAEELIQNHTMFPIAAFLMSAEKAERVKVAMRGDRAGAMNLIKWHRKRAQDGLRHLYFCAKCRERDIRTVGHTWWRRVHQTPGVLCCPIHATPLEVSQFVIGQFWKLDYPTADDAKSTRQAPPPDGIDLTYARDVRWMLNNPPKPIDSKRLQRLYHDQTDKLGLLQDGRLHRTEFLNRFYAQRSEHEWKQRTLLFDPANASAWPAQTIKNKVNHQSVQMHLLVMRFLNLSIANIHSRLASIKEDDHGDTQPNEILLRAELRKRWFDPNWPLEKTTLKFGVGSARILRLAAEEGLPIPRLPDARKLKKFHLNRARYRKVILCGETASTSKEWLTAKRWLCRNDRRWFMDLKPRSAVGEKRHIVDWAAREKAYINKLPLFVSRVRAERPFRLVSLTALISLLPFGASMGTRLRQKMPGLYAEMRRVRETAEEFTLRRIQVIRQLYPNLRPYEVRERAAVLRSYTSPKVLKAMGYVLVGSYWRTPESPNHPLYGIAAGSRLRL